MTQNVSNQIITYIDEVRRNADRLKHSVENARVQWDDANYECVALAAAHDIYEDACSFCTYAMENAQMINKDIRTIINIINQL